LKEAAADRCGPTFGLERELVLGLPTASVTGYIRFSWQTDLSVTIESYRPVW
jgi:hypothetical protein